MDKIRLSIDKARNKYDILLNTVIRLYLTNKQAQTEVLFDQDIQRIEILLACHFATHFGETDLLFS